ncbi:hypothetical protein A3A50_02740 [Candidatus Woesebacteria bacterium RIFCSPLOWO2_01_FULL_38_20]|nr:MAG: hypothetical protein A3A50_02740 [Candidatus Woesebacteria bacterium RIFCSPLOWO2_01_FULL_38_20]
MGLEEKSLVISTIEKSSVKSPEVELGKRSFGLIMIKPHAYEQVIDVPVGQLLGFSPEPPSDEMIKLLKLSSDTEKLLFRSGKFKPVAVFARDMGNNNPNMGGKYEELMGIMYGRDRDRRHYRTILERYQGKVMFFLVQYEGSQSEMEDVLREFKGKETFVGESQGSGIRGRFILPRKRIDLDKLEGLPEDEYRKQVPNVVDNAIHITDNPWETATALKILLSKEDKKAIEERGFPIEEYIKDNEKEK